MTSVRQPVLAFTFPDWADLIARPGVPWRKLDSWSTLDRVTAVVGPGVEELLLDASHDEPALPGARSLAAIGLGLVIERALLDVGVAPAIRIGRGVGRYAASIASGTSSIDEVAAELTSRSEPWPRPSDTDGVGDSTERTASFELARRQRSRVLFRESVWRAARCGASTFLQLGAFGHLTRLVAGFVPGCGTATIATPATLSLAQRIGRGELVLVDDAPSRSALLDAVHPGLVMWKRSEYAAYRSRTHSAETPNAARS